MTYIIYQVSILGIKNDTVEHMKTVKYNDTLDIIVIRVL